MCACEDVGLAYPMIIPIVQAAVDAALQVGLPEARIPLADAVVLVCTAPKSNSAYKGINAAVSYTHLCYVRNYLNGLPTVNALALI